MREPIVELRNLLLLLLISILPATSILGQIPRASQQSDFKDPVAFTLTTEKNAPNDYTIVIKAKIENGWHFYSQESKGTLPLTYGFDNPDGFEVIGKLKESPKPIQKYDEVMKGLTQFWEKEATLKQRVKLTKVGEVNMLLWFDGQACLEDGMCLPVTPEFEIKLVGEEVGTTQSNTVPVKVLDDPNTTEERITDQPTGEEQVEESTTSNAKDDIESNTKVDLWEPVIEELQAFEDGKSITDKSFLLIFILGFLGGLVALLTPCVWPMIPMTVSFFIKQSDKGKGKRDAILYGLSIVVIFVTLGLGITAIFGADAMNALATSAGFNIAFFVILVIFAAAFLGAFELTLPSSWVNKMDAKADSKSGIVSIFLMAFTLVLVSFSCTGPIVGTLLVESITKGFWGPFYGMLGFSIALALPFSLFAFFPTMMSNMPKSGGWLNSVKVVLGFLELALALKFLSVADMAYHWGILDREVFLVLWIVIFAMLGFYLLGKLKFSHDSDLKHIGVGRLGLAIISLAFAIYMIPGLWGAPLKAISAFSPPYSTQDFNLYDGAVHAHYDDYELAIEAGKKQNKPVLVDFTGWGCVNCRNVEAAVWSDPRVRELLEEEYVLVSLYCDDKKQLPEEDKYKSSFTGKTIRTVGNKWSDLQIGKFGSNSQPKYIPLDHDGKPLTGARDYKTSMDVEEYIKFLEEGIKEFKKQK